MSVEVEIPIGIEGSNRQVFHILWQNWSKHGVKHYAIRSTILLILHITLNKKLLQPTDSRPHKSVLLMLYRVMQSLLLLLSS